MSIVAFENRGKIKVCENVFKKFNLALIITVVVSFNVADKKQLTSKVLYQSAPRVSPLKNSSQ